MTNSKITLEFIDRRGGTFCNECFIEYSGEFIHHFFRRVEEIFKTLVQYTRTEKRVGSRRPSEEVSVRAATRVFWSCKHKDVQPMDLKRAPTFFVCSERRHFVSPMIKGPLNWGLALWFTRDARLVPNRMLGITP